MRVITVVAASVALLAASSNPASAQTRSRVYSPQEQSDFAPPIDLWLDQVSYDYGERIRPYFATEPGAYVTIVRVSTDGELRVLYPRRPSAQTPYVIGQFTNDRLSHGFDRAFNLYETTGTGFVFAIASYSRFNYAYFTAGGQWSTARLASYGRNGDPFEIAQRFVDRTLSERDEFSMDYVSYEVYSQRDRSRYASRYVYSSLDDYYDRCLSAFGFRYTSHCRSYDGYYGRYYGPIVLGPRRPPPTVARQPREPRIRPLVPDPVVPAGPLGQQPAEGRFPTTNPSEAAAIARRERMVRTASPRTNPREPMVERGTFERERGVERREREPVIYRSQPRAEPRAEPRFEPRFEPRQQPRQRVEPRSEPRSEPRPQGRVETRSEPRPQPRVETRSEPRQHQPRSEPPKTRDKQ